MYYEKYMNTNLPLPLYRIIGAIAFLGALIALVFWFTHSHDYIPIVEGDSAEIGVTQAKTISGITIRFNALVADYRCPSDAECMEAGAVVANVTYTHDGETRVFNMPSDEVPQEFSGYAISIIDIQPSLRSNEKIDPMDYRVTFRVVKK